MKTQKQIDIERNIRNKRYTAYIPRYIAEKFDPKLHSEGLHFSEWLKASMEKYLKKN